MGIADDLHKLDELRQSGALSEVEFQQAKAIVLANPSMSANARISPFVEEQMARVGYQNELARIDRQWEIDREQFRIVGRHGRTFFPTVSMGVGSAVAGAFFGVFWTVIAMLVASMFPSDQPFGMVKIALPLIGILFTIIVVGRGISLCLRAHKYNDAYHAYQDIRGNVHSPEEVDKSKRGAEFTQTA